MENGWNFDGFSDWNFDRNYKEHFPTSFSSWDVQLLKVTVNFVSKIYY